MEVIDAIIREVGSWLMVALEVKDISLNVFMRDWVSCMLYCTYKESIAVKKWEPPP